MKILMNTLVLMLLAGTTVGVASASTGGVLRGTAMYRERIARPPGAVLEVRLEDISRADVPAELLGSVRLEELGNPPFGFEISYDPGVIDERHTYAVRATIHVEESLVFTTDTVHPVLTRGAGDKVELMLVRVEPPPTAELLDTRWKLTDIADEPVVLVENQREPHLVLYSQEGRVNGFAGCNRFNASYEIDGQSITFGPMATTRMACMHGEGIERAFLDALGKTATLRHQGLHLELLDEEGTVLARFEARYLE